MNTPFLERGKAYLREGKPRKRIIISGIFLSLLLLQTSGVLVFEYYKGTFKSEHTAVGNVNALVHNDIGATWGTSNTKAETRFSGWRFGSNVSLSFGNPRVTEASKVLLSSVQEREHADSALAKIVERKLNELRLSQQFDVALIQSSEKTGLYWLPVVKNGTYIYDIFIKRNNILDPYTIQFTGTVDFQVIGLCQIKELDEQIATLIVKQIEDRLKYRSQ